MTVARSGGAALAILYSPVGLICEGEEVQLVQIVVCELSAT